MRSLPLLALAVLAAPVHVGAQGIAVPVRCTGACPAAQALPRILLGDSVGVSADVKSDGSTTYVNHRFHNSTGGEIDGAFFFPLPDDATVTGASVFDGTELKQYGEWSTPGESRRMLDSIVRASRGSPLRVYRGRNVVHVRIPSIPAHGSVGLKLGYTQPSHGEAGALAYDYPLSAGAGEVPFTHFALTAQVTTARGFGSISSSSHVVEVRAGTEMGRCPPAARCGYTGVPSRRVKVVTLTAGAEAAARDFRLEYTPLEQSGPAEPPMPGRS
jgi:hypothetical protein